MQSKMTASGLEYALEDCAIVKFIIPPLELPDGKIIRLRDANAVFPPIKMLVNTGDGQPIMALFHPTEGRWEIVKEERS